jgi:hypothetical protein
MAVCASATGGYNSRTELSQSGPHALAHSHHLNDRGYAQATAPAATEHDHTMSQRQAAIDYYHELCTTGTLAHDSWEHLLPGMGARGLIFGTRPLTTVLRPLMHAGMDWHYLRWRSTIVLGVFPQNGRRHAGRPGPARPGVPDARRRRTDPDPHRLPHRAAHRAAGQLLDRPPRRRYTLNYVELNGESPASMAYSDVLAELFLETPLMQRFQERYFVDTLMARRSAVDALLRIYYTWRGNRDKLPDIAIVDWEGVPTTTEFHLFVDYFARYGITVTICEPARYGVPRRRALRRRAPGGLRLQARAHDRAAAKIRAGSPDHLRAASRRHLHGKPVPLQAGAQESQLCRGFGRAQRLSVQRARA